MGARKNGRARETRVYLSRAPFFPMPLLPSACYAGYLRGNQLVVCVRLSDGQKVAKTRSCENKAKVFLLSYSIEKANNLLLDT